MTVETSNEDLGQIGTLAAAARDPLADLWWRRLDTLTSGIANGDTYYLQIANAAEHVSAEHQGRFLVELIQNANDQAVRQKAVESRVSIVRTEALVAVGNSGQPFDLSKVESITSLFRSDKTADVCIGNKGIGFKAVFQVSDSAEIYSSAEGSSLSEDPEIAFRMDRRPFDDPVFRHEIRCLVESILARNSDRAHAIQFRYHDEGATEVVLREAARAAGFTFPLRLTKEDFRARVVQLGLSQETLAATQTLVVLPLNESAPSFGRIGAALDDICGTAGQEGDLPGVSFLFLPGITRLEVVDRVRGFRAELEKTTGLGAEESVGRATLRNVTTSSSRTNLSGDGPVAQSSRKVWWMVERAFGGQTLKEDQWAAEEREALRSAIRSLNLPEENWKDVQSVPVALALPVPDERENETSGARPLGPHGRFCIGLPSHVSTGLPIWVSAHFHGKIDRTAIDFSNRYNTLLLDAAEDLASVLLDWIKSMPGLSHRRMATLALERGDGELAARCYAEKGLARKAVVLGADGSFLKPERLRLPRAADLEMFEMLADGVSDLGGRGFVLPDGVLLRNARSVLDGLVTQADVPDDSYFARPTGSTSLLELAAAKHRANGPAFWERFLSWVVTRLTVNFPDKVADQAILPTAEVVLSKPNDRVFFAPASAGARIGDAVDSRHVIDEAGEELTAIDESVASLLRLFDERAIRIRIGTGRDYSPIALKLAPLTGVGLVRRPRQVEIVNDALIPALKESKGDSDQALVLLRQALGWLVAMPQKSRTRVDVEGLLVPVCGSGEDWSWSAPNDAYLGEGWTDDPMVDLLSRTFGARSNKRLIPWDRFEKKLNQLFGSADRGWWSQAMKEIGVWDCPRVIQSDRRLHVMRSYSLASLDVIEGVECPTSCAEGVWAAYLADISRRKALTRSGQDFYLKDVSWIEGLESEDIRSIVVEGILRRPERYKPFEATTLSRWSGEDPSSAPALWVHAIRTRNWEVIPTSFGLRGPKAAWFLPVEARSTKSDRFGFLPCVPADLSASRDTLSRLGVISLEEATISRLCGTLHDLAKQAAHVRPETLRHFNALVHDLYEAIQTRLRAKDPSESLEAIRHDAVPLLRGDVIECTALNEVSCLYVDDDPVRRRFLDGLDGAWFLPNRSQQSYSDLIDALRALLGTDRIRKVSECPLALGFAPIDAGTALLEFLRRKHPERSIEEDLALLILKGGNQVSSPHEPVFQRAWSEVRKARVVRGTFGEGAKHRACYDNRHEGGAALLVDASLLSHEIVAEMWQILRPAYRDVFAAYAQALIGGRTDAFFSDRGVSLTERTDVEGVIGGGFSQALQRFQAVCLARWRSRNAGRVVSEFRQEWDANTRTVESAREWLDWALVDGDVESAARLAEENGVIELLGKLQLSVSQWQQARIDLGVAIFRFVTTERHYAKVRGSLVGRLMALFAYLVVPRASGSRGPVIEPGLAGDVLDWTRLAKALQASGELVGQQLGEFAIARRAASDILALVGHNPSIAALDLLTTPLRDFAAAGPTDTGATKLGSEPDKAATIYEIDDEALRTLHAKSAVEALLKVAEALAVRGGEDFDRESLQGHPLVVLLSSGSWANRVSVLAAVRFALETLVPTTAARMKARQAFRDVDDWRTLWGKFEELGEIPKPAAPAAPKPRFEMLGRGWTEEEFASTAGDGPGGELVRRLEGCVNPSLDLSSLRDQERDVVNVGPSNSGAGGGNGGTGGGGGRRRPPDHVLKSLGAVAEHFFFQQMKRVLDDFDLTNWRSCAREAFGYGPGDDGLGYDFEYHDARGVLSGNASIPRCLIEVKSTSGETFDAFELTAKEWDVARRCHLGSESATYLIVRIIRTATRPELLDILVDPPRLFADGVLSFSSRDLTVVVGKPRRLV